MIADYIKILKFTHFGLWISYYKRKFKLKKYINDIRSKYFNILEIDNDYKIDRSKGYKIIDFKNKNDINDVIKFCEINFPIDFIKNNNKNTSKDNRLNIADIDLNDPKNKIIKDFCVNKYLIKSISNYLDDIPILLSATVWFCPNQISNNLIGSQLYHFDREDFRQIKCFIPIEDIDKQSGPLTLISSRNSMKFILKKFFNFQLVSSKSRFTDTQIKRYFKDQIEIELECKRGQVAMVDTSQCLHYGSRPAKKYKYHISIQYVSPYSTKLDKFSDHFSQTNKPEDLILKKFNLQS